MTTPRIAWMAVLFFARAASAQAPSGNPSGVGDATVDRFAGELNHRLPIQIPAYHGLEPSIALHYHSGARNGFVGVGWSLSGVSVIQRGSAGKGTPTYTNSDLFFLDGMELTPCASGSLSPSCAAGGSHSTKIESYLRVLYDSTWDLFKVTTKDGTSALYAPIYTVAGKTYRYGVVSVFDTRGNTVSYNWWCDPNADCYPASVTYDGYAVAFVREARPDPLLFSNGGFIGTTNYRLKQINVLVNGNIAREYVLQYAPSARTSRSLLVGVQQLGINGAPGVPAIAINYPPEADGTFNLVGGSSSADNTASFVGAPPGLQAVDVTGDGRADVIHITTNPGDVRTWISKGDGSYNVVKYVSSFDTCLASNTAGACGQWLFGDVDGNGTVDLIHLTTAGGDVRTWLSNGDGTYSVKDYVSSTDTNLNGSGSWQVGDVNGDGKMDLIHLTGNSGDVRTWLSNSDGSYNVVQYVSASDQNLQDGAGLVAADINGDGKADLLHATTNSGDVRTWISNGDGSYRVVQYVSSSDTCLAASSCNSSWQYADVNGDGNTDLIHITGTNGDVRTWLSVGDGRYTVSQVVTPDGTPWGQSVWYAADFNGDGLVDLYHNSSQSFYGTLWTSRGDGTYALAGNGPGGVAYLVGDFDGDGKADLASPFTPAGSSSAAIWANLSQGAPGELLSSITNGAGGTTSVVYSPSSAWSNSNLPFIVQTVSQVTRATTPAAPVQGGPLPWSMTTAYSYAGGLWDPIDRRFLGFHYVKQILPCLPSDGSACAQPGGQPVAGTSPFEETWFSQDYATASLPGEVRRSTGAGVVLSDIFHQYVKGGNPWSIVFFGHTFTFTLPPYTALETDRWDYVYDGSGAACATWPCANGERKHVAYTYDNYNAATQTFGSGYGNRTSVIEYGDADLGGDERTSVYRYAPPNTSLYLVGLPSVVDLFQGAGASGALLGETQTCYDQPHSSSPSSTVMPTVGDLTAVLRWLDTKPGYVMESLAYDNYGNVIWTSDENQHQTQLTYDPVFHLYLTSTTNHLQQTQSISYDFQTPGGACAGTCLLPTRVTDMNNQTASIQYDAFGRLTEVDSPLGGFERHVYCTASAQPCGSIANQCGCTSGASAQYIEVDRPSADGNGPQWMRSYFDGLGRVWRSQWKGPNAGQSTISVDTTFAGRGQTAQQSTAYYPSDTPVSVSYVYDVLDRVTEIDLPDGNHVTRTYGMQSCPSPAAATCFATTSADELGHPSTVLSDALGRVVRRSDSRGGTSLTYDLRDRLIGIIDPAGNQWSYGTDSLSRLTSLGDPDFANWTFQYDAASNLTTQTDAKGQKTALTFDALNRKTSTTLVAETASASTTFWRYDEARAGYANLGHLTSTLDAAGTHTINYDAAGRTVSLTRMVAGSSYSFNYGYDAGSRLTGIRYPDSDVIGQDPLASSGAPFTYDGAGRMSATPGVVDSATYDATGHLTTLADHNGTTTTQTYSPTRGWLTGIQTMNGSGAGATWLQQLAYTRDQKGRVTLLTSPSCQEGWSYAYDDVDRLVSAMDLSTPANSIGMSYDPIDNITYNSRLGHYTYPPRNQPHAVAQAGGNQYGYDQNGNMTSRAGQSISYDGLDRPTNVNGVAMTYDADGLRVSKAGAATTHYVGDDFEDTGGVYTKYIRLGGRRVAKRVSGGTYWLHSDALGSPNVITDFSGGAAHELWRQKYTPYGEKLSTSTAFGESTAFGGERQDETGLVYLHARYYDPLLGRFISADHAPPVNSGVGLNHYAYGGNNPVGHSDHSGYDFWGDGGGGGWGFTGNGFPTFDGAIEAAGLGGNVVLRFLSYLFHGHSTSFGPSGPPPVTNMWVCGGSSTDFTGTLPGYSITGELSGETVGVSPASQQSEAEQAVPEALIADVPTSAPVPKQAPSAAPAAAPGEEPFTPEDLQRAKEAGLEATITGEREHHGGEHAPPYNERALYWADIALKGVSVPVEHLIDHTLEHAAAKALKTGAAALPKGTGMLLKGPLKLVDLALRIPAIQEGIKTGNNDLLLQEGISAGMGFIPIIGVPMQLLWDGMRSGLEPGQPATWEPPPYMY